LAAFKRFGVFAPYERLRTHRQSLLGKPGRVGLDGRCTRARDLCLAALEPGCASAYR